MQVDLTRGNLVSKTVYTHLIKASWILSDVITKHPQLSLLEATIHYEVQGLAEVRQLTRLYFPKGACMHPFDWSFGLFDLESTDIE